MRLNPGVEKHKLPKRLVISAGGHESIGEGGCLLEWAAYLGGEEHSHAPECVCESVQTLAIGLNDTMPSDAMRTKMLAPLLRKLVGSKTTKRVRTHRLFALCDFMIRTMAPRYMRRHGRLAAACKLRSLRPIRGTATLRAARRAIVTDGDMQSALDVRSSFLLSDLGRYGDCNIYLERVGEDIARAIDEHDPNDFRLVIRCLKRVLEIRS